jgi:hypothetical protein
LSGPGGRSTYKTSGQDSKWPHHEIERQKEGENGEGLPVHEREKRIHRERGDACGQDEPRNDDHHQPGVRHAVSGDIDRALLGGHGRPSCACRYEKGCDESHRILLRFGRVSSAVGLRRSYAVLTLE